MAEKYPPQTWQDGSTPSTGQLRTWLHRHGHEHDARIAADMILGMLEDQVRLRDQERRQAAHTLELRAATVRVYGRKALRYRAAWLSARRRARIGALRRQLEGG